jgi:oxygen-independent coproporphyrinogen-3 oxidase
MASARIEYDGKKACGRAWVPRGKPPDNALRMAFYRAAKQLTAAPPWGALTGVRPVKKAVEIADGGGNIVRELQRVYDVTPERARMAADCAACAVSMRETLGPKDIALYIGIPFCPTRCAYCSFVPRSAEGDAGSIGRYIDVLLDEIKLAGETLERFDARVRAVYWGGGTPAVLSEGQFSKLAGALRRHMPLEHCLEYTVEAGRPDVITIEKLASYREYGAGRISVNPQTLDQAVLDGIGRGHTADQFFAAYEAARKSGFGHINVDLISGLPGEDAPAFLSGVERIFRLGAENITIHTLAKKRSSFIKYAGSGVCPPSLELYEEGYKPYYLYRQKFTAGGFENTGWTKPGFECIYNLMMMEELAPVLSLGAGGVSKAVTGGRIERITHCKYPLEYIGRCDTMESKMTAFAGLLWER